jgi:hypothetical protein
MPSAGLEEAQDWKERTLKQNRKPDLVEALEGEYTDVMLISAFNAWWEVYSMYVRYAPSNRRGQGISADHAARAGLAADHFAVMILRNWK